MAEWYYTTGGQQTGPVPIDDVRQALSTRRLGPQDMVWTESWTAWRQAGEVPELRRDGEPTPGGMEYYAVQSVLPLRTAQSLADFAAPTGDVGPSPIGDAELAALTHAGYHRHRIRRAVTLYRVLCVANFTFILFAAIGILMDDTMTRTELVGVSILLGMAAAQGVLYALAASATRRNYAWGGWMAIALLAVTLIGSVFVTAIALFSDDSDSDTKLGAVLFVCVIGLMVVTVVLAVRGLGAVGKFRATPAWCQEALLRGETAKRPVDG